MIGAVVLAGLAFLAPLLFPPPYPSQFLRPGVMGFFIPPVVALWACCMLSRRYRATWALSALLVALVCVPMVVGPGWYVPLWEAWGWALTGSASGVAAAAFGTGVLALGLWGLVADLLATTGRGPSKWWGWLPAGLALALLLAAVPLRAWAMPGADLWELGASGLGLCLAAVLTGKAVGDVAVVVEGQPWVPELTEWLRAVGRVVPVSLLVAVYFVLKLETVAWSATDENIYFQAARWVTDGRVPYKEFFFSHPPLHLLIPALALKLFGDVPYLLKLLPVLFSVGSGLLVYLSVLRRSGLVSSLLSAVFFFFALEQLQASTNLTGINITTFFVMLSFYSILTPRPWLAASAACAALMSGAYSAIPLLALVLPAFLFWGPGFGVRYLGGLLGGSSLLNGLCGFIFGSNFFEQVYLYHFRKAPAQAAGYLSPTGWDFVAFGLVGAAAILVAWLAWMWRQSTDQGQQMRWRALVSRRWGVPVAGAALLVVAGVIVSYSLVQVPVVPEGTAPLPASFGGIFLLWANLRVLAGDDEFLRFAYFHSHLLLAVPLLGLMTVLTRFNRRRNPVPSTNSWQAGWVGILLLLAALIQLSLVKETFTFYYLLAIPGGAMALGCAWGLLLQWIPHPVPHPVLPARSDFSLARSRLAVSGLVLGLLVCFSLDQPLSLAIGADRWPEELKPANTLTCYPWREGISTPFSALIRRWLHTPCRVRGSVELGLYHYLWRKKVYFSRAEEIGEYIRQRSKPGDTILGASVVAPLLASLSGRDLAAGYVDTNSKRFKAGMVENRQGALDSCKQNQETDETRCLQNAAWREMWDKACRTPLRFIVAAPKSAFQVSELSRNPLIRKYFRPVGLFNEPMLSQDGKYPIVLFERVNEKPDAAGRYCGF